MRKARAILYDYWPLLGVVALIGYCGFEIARAFMEVIVLGD